MFPLVSDPELQETTNIPRFFLNVTTPSELHEIGYVGHVCKFRAVHMLHRAAGHRDTQWQRQGGQEEEERKGNEEEEERNGNAKEETADEEDEE